jgi:predicted extracellular nuclease
MRIFYKTLIISTLIFIHFSVDAQSNRLYIAHYNVENLFDTIDDPKINDEEFLPGGKNNWTAERYATKLERLSQVVLAMNNGTGPDLLGICEIENRQVADDLRQRIHQKGRKYALAHFESPDNRGIDVGLIYDSKKFKLLRAQSLTVTLPGDKPWPTRDVLLVTGQLSNKARLHVFVNHWPSRSGGQEKSEPNRMAAARVVRQAIDSLLKADPTAHILTMGDFNDGPADIAPRQIMGADTLIKSTAPLYNPFLALNSDSTQGSYNYRGSWQFIDHISISTHSLNQNSKIKYIWGSAKAEKFDFLLEKEGRYAGNPWRSFAGSNYLGGYSDHLPVSIQIELRK